MNKSSKDLEREHEEAMEWDSNPVKRAITIMFGERLSEESYRKLPVDEAVRYIQESFLTQGAFNPKYQKTATRLLNKAKKADSTQSIVMILGEYLLA